ncbi:MAG: ribosome maturation factor RimP [Clostridia bacterium]|nr:ribosome maturation factor RimP [Clostridia bacterium]
MAEGKIVTVVREAVEGEIERLGYELVDVEFVKEGPRKYLRLYIDKEGGVSIDDCVAVNDVAGPIIDGLDPIDEPYVFEVSSPGFDRPFKTDKDYEKNVGNKVDVSLFAPVKGNRKFTGVLKERRGGKVIIAEGENEIVIDEADISVIRRTVEF